MFAPRPDGAILTWPEGLLGGQAEAPPVVRSPASRRGGGRAFRTASRQPARAGPAGGEKAGAGEEEEETQRAVRKCEGIVARTHEPGRYYRTHNEVLAARTAEPP